MVQEQKYPVDWKRFRAISIMDVLQRMGHFPVRTTRKEAWFLSPLRSENNASFKVSLIKNRWYDFGIGKGGNSIDLVMQLHSCTAWEAVAFLLVGGSESVFIPPIRQQEPESKIRINKTRPLRRQALLEYLRSRSIPAPIARQYCQEVHYSIGGKRYFSVGLQNVKGGWELRNKYLKNSSSPKSFSLISRESDQIIITEGMFDLLSLDLLERELVRTSDCLVLNSLSFLTDIKAILPRYKRLLLYLDNDPAGRNAANYFLSKFDTARDRSGRYRPFSDPNEWLQYEHSK